MKRTFTLLLLTILSVCAWAQTNPNRMIVTDKIGGMKGFLVERIDSLFFAQIEGRVAADIVFKGFKTGETGDTINLAVTRTDECWSYQITVVPTNTMSYLRDEATLASFVERQGGTFYSQDFTNAEMTGFEFEFEPNAEYTLVTLGYDKYGIACSTSQATFRTPAPQIVGNPHVDAVVDEVSATSFTITFTPNKDVSIYSVCSFPKGQLQQQFQTFGPMFGFATIGQMIFSWGIPTSTVYTNTWTGMIPATEYEVFIQPLDANGNYAEYTCVEVATTTPGGEGTPEVKIELGYGYDYEYEDQQKWVQQIVITPNDETGIYHSLLVTADFYENNGGDAEFDKLMKESTNPYNPWDSYWDLTGTDSSYWQLDYDTDYVMLAMPKNGLGEWGELTKLEFSTPKLPEASLAKPKANMPARIVKTVTEGVTLPTIKPEMMMRHGGIRIK